MELLGFFVIAAVIVWIIYDQKKLKETPKAAETQTVKLCEFFGDPQATNYIKKFKTMAVGVSKNNADGSSRQEAIKRLRKGQKVRLVWDKNNSYDPNAVMLFPNETDMFLDMQFGFLKTDLAADVVKWVTQEDKSVYAEVAQKKRKTEDFPFSGVLLEITVYKSE